MKSLINKKEDNTIELTITIPSEVVKKTKEEVLDEIVKTIELPGFRKGKAPKKLVEEKVSKEKINEETLRKLLPKGYIEAVKEHNLRPIINPKIHVEKIKEGEDWVFQASTCEVPKIDLDNYKEEIKKITAKSKIVIPGKEQKPVSLDELIKTLLESVKVKVPQILVEQEIDRRLSQMLDEIRSLGLSLDQYLSSTGKTAESLRDEHKKKAEDDIKLEFTLQKIAEVEKITVEEKEIDEAVQKAKDETERKHLMDNRYLLASIIKQQKSLDFLKNL